MIVLGPNTNASSDLLAPACILCCGEDRQTLLQAVEAAGLTRPWKNFSYRCYEFWKTDQWVLIWTGIGTGCLEPLLWEIFQPGIINKIVLIGTAGRMPDSLAAPGQVYLVDQAFLAGTGLDGEQLAEPLHPRWPQPRRFAETSSVSTDFYYGFSPKIESGEYPLASGRLRSAYSLHRKHGTNLVEMEVGPFYAFCAVLPNAPARFIAAKVVSNTVGDEGNQVPNSAQALKLAVAAAKALLGLT